MSKAEIQYHDIDNYLSREVKLDIIRKFKHIRNGDIRFSDDDLYFEGELVIDTEED